MSESPWYDVAFGAHYDQVYPHRDDASAAREVAAVLSWEALAPGSRVLDLGCGNGRHLQALGQRGFDAWGLDRSRALLRRARQRRVGRVLRADLRRLPFPEASFDAAFSFFTSFGLLESSEEDRRVLRESARVLRSGGFLFLDFLDAGHTREHLVPEDERSWPGGRLHQQRRIEGGCVRKRVRLQLEGQPEITYEEAVRLYEREDLIALLRAVGLEPSRQHGSYEEASWGAGPRALVTARKE